MNQEDKTILITIKGFNRLNHIIDKATDKILGKILEQMVLSRIAGKTFLKRIERIE